ncbi:MAG TPA: hypothetical protein VGL62_06975 [Vicinamibacterales bacterium]
MAKVKTWVWVVTGLVVAGIVCLIALAGAGLWFARTHIQITRTSTATVSKEFEEVRSRFASQPPLIELDDDGRFVHANTDRPTKGPQPDSLHILAFNPRDDRVVRMSIPFWLLRLKGAGSPITIGDDFDMNQLKITVADLERYGPTLIVDHTSRDGGRVLVWSQ